MTLSKSVITGRFPTPDDTVASAALVKFMLSGVDSVSPDIVIPATVSVALVDGELPAGFDLWQNTDGLNGTHYKVYAITIGVDAFGRNTLPGEYYLGRMTVGNSATYALADLLVVPFVEPTTADAVALCQTYAIDVAEDAAATAADRVQTGADVMLADAARALTEAARDAAIAGAGLTFPSTAAGLGQGINGVTSIVAGTGGANGTFALAFTGGTQVLAPVGVFTVAGGALVSVIITYPGYYSAGTPTLSFAASAGLTGASATAVMAANTPVGGYFSIPAPATDETVVYRVDAGPVATEVARLLTSAFLAKFADMNGYLDPGNLFRWIDAAGRTVGRVDVSAQWHILLGALETAAGTALEQYERCGADTGLLLLDAEYRIIADLLVSQQAAAVIAEVEAARGDRANLSDRLDESMTSTGAPRDTILNRAALRTAHWKMIALDLGDTQQLNIAAVGDSYTQNAARYTGPLATYLTGRYGDGGGGWTGYGFFSAGSPPYVIAGAQPAGVNGNARPTSYALKFRGVWVCTYNNSPSPDCAHITSSTAGDMIQRTVPASPNHSALRVHFLGTADGVVRHRVDGGSWTTQNVQGTIGALQMFDIALTAGAHTVEIEVVSGTVSLCGDNALSSATGVRLHKLGGSGSSVNSWWNQNAASQQTGWADLTPDIFWVMEAGNSQSNAIAPATWISRWSDLVGRMRTASPLADILMVGTIELIGRDAPTYTPIADYAAQARQFAWTNDYAFLSLQDYFGADKTTYASTSPRPLLNADGLHPEPPTGGRLMVAAMLDILLPY